MAPPALGSLTLRPALDHPDLLGAPVAALLATWPHAAEVYVAAIDPALADTAAFSEAYDVPLEASANCVIVAGKRAGEERVAACVVRADTRADVNGLVKRTLDVRKASFLPMERAVEEAGMEHGGITPFGLPVAAEDRPGWRILVDAACLEIPWALLGSGVRHSKVVVPGARLADLPGAEVLDALGLPA